MTIYTVIIGAFDDLKPPTVITKGWNYVCYTDQPYTSDVWEIRKVTATPDRERLLAKEIKIAPHRFMDIDHSLYIDGSFIVNCDLNEFWKRFKDPLTFVQHPFRNCVYKEGHACSKHGKDDPILIRQQLIRYRKIGIPSNNGMAASGVIMRRHCKETNQFGDIWYDEVKNYSKRDQIGWGFANFKMPISHKAKFDYRNDREFLHVPHLQYPIHRAARIQFYQSKKIIE